MIGAASAIYNFVRLHHEETIPYRGHVEPGIVLNKGARAMAMLRLFGHQGFELSSGRFRRSRAQAFNALLVQLADPSVELCFHLVHHRRVSDPPQLKSSVPFIREMMEQYERTALRNMFSNDWFITPIVDPPPTARRALREHIGLGRKDKILALADGQRRHLEEIVSQIANTLSEYGVERLGMEMVPTDMEDVDAPITEIGTALRMIRTAQFEPVPHTWGSLGAAIYDEEVHVHPLHFDTGIGDERYGAILCFLNYPATARNGMLNTLLSAPYPLVVSHSFRYKSLSALAAAYTIVLRQMKNAGSFAKRLATGVEDAVEEIEAAEAAAGCHHFQVAVYAKSPADLEGIVSDAKSRLSRHGGATVKRERNIWYDGALESQYYAQLPGTEHLKPAPADISTADIAAMVSLDNYPAGHKHGYWGPSPIRLRTRAGTAWDLTVHDEDVGHFIMVGPNGRGKSVWAGVLTSAMEPVMGANGIRLVIDKDDSNRLWIEASGGRHQRLLRHQASGLAPLRAYDDSPASRSFLWGLFKYCMEHDGAGSIGPDTERRLLRGIIRQLKMPRHLRTMGGVRLFLGYGPNNEGLRFERWCRGGPMGWLLDNDRQTIHVGPGLQGYDFGDLLPREGMADDGAATIAAACIAHELRQLMDGRRIFCLFEECKFYIEVLQRLIEDLTLTGRKKELVCGLIFQQPEHAMDSAIGSALVAQMRRKYVFPDANYQPEHLRKLGLSEPAIRQVRGEMTVGNARRILVWDKEPVVVDFDLTGMPQLDILSARPGSVKLFDAIRLNKPEAELGEVVDLFHRQWAKEREAA